MASTVPLWILLAPSVVAIVAIVAAELRDRRRLKQELLMKDAELEAAREARLRDERIIAYRKFLAATTTAHVEREGVAALRDAYAEISLLTSTDELDKAALEVKLAYFQAQDASYRQKQDLEAPTEGSGLPLRRADVARDRFLLLALKELGLEGRTAGYRDLEGSTPDE